MKKNNLLTQMSPIVEMLHEEDKKQFPERHWLTKDSYSKQEMSDMCFLCADHYEWGKQLEYNARLDIYFNLIENNLWNTQNA